MKRERKRLLEITGWKERWWRCEAEGDCGRWVQERGGGEEMRGERKWEAKRGPYVWNHISDYPEFDYRFGFLGQATAQWGTNNMYVNIANIHTSTNVSMLMYTQHSTVKPQKLIFFSHFVLTSVPRLHRLQFSDLIGPTNWSSAHLMLTRNWPITVF